MDVVESERCPSAKKETNHGQNHKTANEQMFVSSMARVE